MIRFLKNLLEIVAWINIFIGPTLILGFVGYLIYYYNKSLLGSGFFIFLSLLGVVLGVYTAERIRRSIGCSTLIFRIFRSDDITKAVSEKKDADKND